MKEVVLKKDILLILKNALETTTDEEYKKKLYDLYYKIAYGTGMR